MNGVWNEDFYTRNVASFPYGNSKLDLVFYKNEVKAGLIGQIPRSLRGC